MKIINIANIVKMEECLAGGIWYQNPSVAITAWSQQHRLSAISKVMDNIHIGAFKYNPFPSVSSKITIEDIQAMYAKFMRSE